MPKGCQKPDFLLRENFLFLFIACCPKRLNLYPLFSPSSGASTTLFDLARTTESSSGPCKDNPGFILFMFSCLGSAPHLCQTSFSHPFLCQINFVLGSKPRLGTWAYWIRFRSLPCCFFNLSRGPRKWRRKSMRCRNSGCNRLCHF